MESITFNNVERVSNQNVLFEPIENKIFKRNIDIFKQLLDSIFHQAPYKPQHSLMLYSATSHIFLFSADF